MKKIQILMSLGLLLLIPLTVLAQEVLKGGTPPVWGPPAPSVKDTVIRRDTSNTPKNTPLLEPGDIRKDLNTKVKVWEPGWKRDIKGDPLLELKEAVRKVIAGEVEDCDTIRATIQKIEEVISTCSMAKYWAELNERMEGSIAPERVERVTLQCQSYGGTDQVLPLYFDLVNFVCGRGDAEPSECYSESERNFNWACDE